MKSILDSKANIFDGLTKLLKEKEDLSRVLSKRESKAFRRYLRGLLSNHDSHTKSWTPLVRRVNRLGRVRPLTVGDREEVSKFMKMRLAMAMANPIRRQLDYAGFARRIFKVEALPDDYERQPDQLTKQHADNA